MSYQRERDQFIAQVSREGLPLYIAEKLLSAATTMQRYAELECSSEAAARDRVPCPATKTGKTDDCLCDLDYQQDPPAHTDVPRIRVKDARLEARTRALMPEGWTITTQGDPRGYVLRVIPPSYAERNAGRDRHNLDSIGVPTR